MAEITNDIGSLFQNKLFLQLLSSAGNDLMTGSGGAKFNEGVQGNIATQNMAKLMKTLLSPDGTKATISKEGVNLTVPKETEMFKSLLGGATPFSADMSLAPNSGGVIPRGAIGGGFNQELFNSQTPEQRRASFDDRWGGGPSMYSTNTTSTLNPFVEGQSGSAVPDIPAADLAGLSPQILASAMGLKQQQEQLKQQSFRDLNKLMLEREAHPVDIAYKKALTKQAEAAAVENTPSVNVALPDGGTIKLTPKDYIAYRKIKSDERTPLMKNYEYAQRQGFTGSLIDFQDASKTTHQKDYDAAVAGGYKGNFNDWLFSLAKTGALNLGELGKREEMKNTYQGEKYFSNPDWTKDLQHHIGSKDIQNRISDVAIPDLGKSATKEQKQAAYKNAVAVERAKVNIEFIEGKIAAGGGKVIENPTMAADKKTVTWKVQWPTGNVSTVTQAVR